MNCEECKGKCCKYINYPASTREAQIFYRARGFMIRDKFAYAELPCPLFKNGKCTIHERKPLICKMMPVGCDECLRCQKLQ